MKVVIRELDDKSLEISQPWYVLKICTRKYAGIRNIEGFLFSFPKDSNTIFLLIISHGQYKMLRRLLSKGQNCPITRAPSYNGDT